MGHVVYGNLITLAKQGVFDVIVHGCNCHHTMGAGIALQIRKEFPQAFEADLRTPLSDPAKLGTYSVAYDGPLAIVNAYTQFDFGTDKPNVDYRAIADVFSLIAKDFAGKKIGYPKIGAGLAGGDWVRISKLIDDALEGQDHCLVEYIG